MKLLADENVPGPLVRELRDRGHDVLFAKEEMRTAPDRQILERAQADGRVLLTFDKDLGELAFRFGLPASSGVILFRLSGATPDEDAAVVLATFERAIEWEGHFSVVTAERIRVRPLGAAPER